jgi:hypothetical protein
MGRDKFENEYLIKYHFPNDIWYSSFCLIVIRFHVDDLSSAHVYLRMKKPIESYDDIPEEVVEECT